MSEDEKREQREIVKEGIKEWMSDQFDAFGRFTLYGLLVASFGGVVYLAMVGMGWHK